MSPPSSASATPQRIPPEIAVWRQRLFDVSEPLDISRSEFDQYWPFCDNFWTKTKQEIGQDGVKKMWLRCRFHKIERQPAAAIKAKRVRQKPTRNPIGCKITIKIVIKSADITISRCSEALHNHTIDYADSIKLNSALRVIAAEEATKGYSVATISTNLTAKHQPKDRQLLALAGGANLTRQHVANAGAAWRYLHPDVRRFGKEEAWQEQVLYGLQFLETEKWKCRLLKATRTIDGLESPGLVFAHPKRLKTLARRGFLVLMDSTHGTNALRWFLYTIMVRDEHGSWVPGAHFLTQKEDSDIAAACLREVKIWCSGGWNLRYMLTDDSAGEQCAVRKAFRGLIDGETEVSHFLCKVHSLRTLRKHLPPKHFPEAFRHINAALYTRRTRAGCEESIEKAMNSLENHPKKREYIRKEWWNTMSDWAHYARCQSALLLQVATTNPVESWHSSLKCQHAKQVMLQWSVEGLLRHVVNIGAVWDKKATKVATEFRTKHLSETARWPGMRRLPYPMQKLVLDERKACLLDIETGYIQNYRHYTNGLYSCKFACKWALPCRHIWLEEETWENVLTEEAWDDFSAAFEDCGFEFYEGRERAWVPIAEEVLPTAPARRRLQVREVMDGILQRYYALEEAAEAIDSQAAEAALEGWIGMLQKSTDSVRQAAVDELLVVKQQDSDLAWDLAQAAGDGDKIAGMDWEEMEG